MRSIMPDWWKWVVLAATVYMNVIVNGYTYCFGLVKIVLQEEYPDVSKWWIAAIGGMVPTGFLFLAPFGIAINEFFGSRAVTIFGSCLSALCFVLVWFNGFFFKGGFLVDMMLLGVGQGVAYALLYGPSLAILPNYFGHGQLSLATGITNAGASAGIMLYGFITYPLFNYFGWRGGMLVYAGLSLQCVLAGFAFTKMVPVKSPEVKSENVEMKEKDAEQALLPKAPNAEIVEPSKPSFVTVLRKYFDAKLICQGPFVLILFSAAFSLTGYYVPTLLVPGQAKKPEFEVSAVLQANIMVIYGLCNLIGRIGSGRIGDYAHKSIIFSSFTLYIGGLVISACACLVFPHVMILGDAAFIGFVIVYGLAAAPIITMRSLLTINLFGKPNANASFGWFLCAQGSVQMIGYILPSFFDTLAPLFAYLFAAAMFLSSAACCALTGKLFFAQRRQMIAELKAEKAAQ